MKKQRLIPFSMMPAAWGLKGRSYKEAEAEYYYEGEELDRQLLTIRFGGSGKQFCIETLAVDLKYGNIDEYDYDLELIKLEHPAGSLALEIAQLDVDLKHGRIPEMQHAKETATLQNQPWVGVLESGFDPDKGVSGLYFELDWNRLWIDQLLEVGYRGNTEQEIIDVWFADVCRSHTEATVYNNVVPFGV